MVRHVKMCLNRWQQSFGYLEVCESRAAKTKIQTFQVLQAWSEGLRDSRTINKRVEMRV